MEKNDQYYEKLEKYSAMCLVGILSNSKENSSNYMINALTATKSAERLMMELENKKWIDKQDKKN